MPSAPLHFLLVNLANWKARKINEAIPRRIKNQAQIRRVFKPLFCASVAASQRLGRLLYKKNTPKAMKMSLSNRAPVSCAIIKSSWSEN